MQECMYKTNIRDIDELHKCLIQTWFDFEQNVTERRCDWPVVRPPEIMCACWW